MSKRESFHLAYSVPLVSYPHEKICYKYSSVENQQIPTSPQPVFLQNGEKATLTNLDQPVMFVLNLHWKNSNSKAELALLNLEENNKKYPGKAFPQLPSYENVTH